MDRLIAHDDSSSDALVRTRGPRMLAVATRYLSNRADAEDARQDAFVNVVRHVSGFKRECSLDTWLHRIVVNCALMSLRRRRRRPEVGLLDSALERGGASPARRRPAPSVSELVVMQETRRGVHRIVDRLPEGQRCTLWLREAGRYELPEVADLPDLGRSTVKARLHRARHALQGSLGLGTAESGGGRSVEPSLMPQRDGVSPRGLPPAMFRRSSVSPSRTNGPRSGPARARALPAVAP